MDYSEKRDFQRMTLDCALEYRVHDKDDARVGQIKNLSATGVLFTADESLALGIEIFITVTAKNSNTPPMTAELKSLRCDKHSDDGKYHVAGEVLSIT